MAGLKTLQVSYDGNGVCWIRLNRPSKFNAFSFQMYDEMIPILQSADADPQCKLIVLTGNGRYFCSGNDQNNFSDPDIADRRNQFRDFITLLIDMKKPIIALVNGPAIGMGVTMLNHCDLVIASDAATFSTPFTKLALVAEGTSSYMFPRIMGYSNAAEMLMFNRKVTAQEMLAWRFVSRVIPHNSFETETKALIEEFSQLSGTALLESKALIRPKELREKLHDANDRESETLRDMYTSPDAIAAVLKFFERKSKL